MDNLLHRVLQFSDEIDQRVPFKIRPRRLPRTHIEIRPEIVYDHMTQTMWDFTGLTDPEVPYWITRQGIKFSHYRSQGDLYIFNMGWEDYQMTMYSGTQIVGPTTCSNHIVTNKRVKFK